MSTNMLLEDVAIPERRERVDRRAKVERRQKSVKPEVERRLGSERRKVERRRQIDPTTCERDYTPDEIEFMTAIDRYRRDNGRPFPTWSEVLEVVRALGYQKAQAIASPPVITGV